MPIGTGTVGGSEVWADHPQEESAWCARCPHPADCARGKPCWAVRNSRTIQPVYLDIEIHNQQIAELIEAGWTKAGIARAIGIDRNGYRPCMTHPYKSVEIRRAMLIQALYLREVGGDTVYGPDAGKPDCSVVERVIAGEDLPMTPVERIEVVHLLTERGMSPSAISRHFRGRTSIARIRQILARGRTWTTVIA